ncbi:glycoside hydrolase family 5 protein [Bipolaris maydis ATCC 48331]|uniref:Glycoside hydrolase family 5 protein n=2 Tax=Cochliobolus heterostrophus TaxID=5016 RepID=M2V0G8_COCH5|nr:glycoside hydrolase family 5 protein [Bipolaris maydis ATCC 48331]EMD93538.1 glycoside hydrolase family 5 protein [Bipolaris maydis C5]KAJ5027850.1 glycoside hydrolase [Bipolaris maydis]ENI07014.1 glycoside hydrolase family 5 protein [Bipolaris maydis ATCC 48331]KAJ6204783.1 glycoside hydrolase family 5 protein [Bipolaris maydis]KAJ6266512.1 glycoside hydrolase [Bipolaris maydis]
MFFGVIWGLLLGSLATAVPQHESKRAAPTLPLSTKGRDIIDTNGNVFHFMSTNWPGHQEIMIPEGLQHSSIEKIVSWFPKLGLNSVRMPFAIEMIDDYLANSPNQTLEKSVLGSIPGTNGTTVLNSILKHNPQFTKNTTRLQVWDAVAKELARQGIFLHLDNHVSKAFWCCGENDGNGWFGEKYFDVEKWKRGLAFMAKHASLRNELRSAKDAEPVDWYTWYIHMTSAANAVHQADPDALIFFSGLSYDTYIDPIPLGKTLSGTAGTSTANKKATFVPTDFAWKSKIVLEIHKYDFEGTKDDCQTFKRKWYQNGFQAVNASDPATKYVFPMVISEWGFINNGVYWNQTTYAKCLVEMVKEYKVGWQHWELCGSFYLQTRPNRQPNTLVGADEAWGILNYDWSAIRSPITLENSLFKMIAALK